MQQMIVVEIAGRGERVDERERRRGPSTMATATARFSDTIGEGCTRSSTIVEPDDLGPVGIFRRAPPGNAAAAIAACSANGPGPPRSASSTSGSASAICC